MAMPLPVRDDGPIRVLLIDDDEDDYLLTRDLLSDIPDSRFQLDWISDSDEALESICRGEHDLYLVDYRLGRSNGLELIRIAVERDCTAPMLLLTGEGQRELDFAAMRAGAADYLEKDKLDAAILERAIRYTLQQKYHSDELERKVRERTAELARTNEVLHAEIAERKRAEEALREADRRKDEFLATLAHELRNPLVPICNALEILRLAGDRADILASNRAMIDRQVRQMVRLIDDLLDISRISRGKIELRIERVELADVIANAVEGSRPLIDRSQHTLSVDLPQSPLAIDADPTRLAQVLLNLLNNAAKYTPPRGRIELSAWTEGSEVAIRVRDTGIGISADQLPNIFRMFAQIHRSHEPSHGGLGIGLSLVRSLIELHGGRVEVHSEGVGCGSTFVVRLPRFREETTPPANLRSISTAER
jgi:signal transduction histidine kinase